MDNRCNLRSGLHGVPPSFRSDQPAILSAIAIRAMAETTEALAA
jgi:hypothetical protein